MPRIMSNPKRHQVQFTAHKVVKEPAEVAFETKAGKHVEFSATKPVREEVHVSFPARNPKGR
jgi:hypothetical protein